MSRDKLVLTEKGEEWVAGFGEVALNCVSGTDGNWLCWVILRGFGTVIWRQWGQVGNKGGPIAWELTGNHGIAPAKCCLFSGCLNLKEKGWLTNSGAAHSRSTLEKWAQHTQNLAAH